MKEFFKKSANILGEIAVGTFKFSKNAFQKMQSEYYDTKDRLEKRGLYEWDEELIKEKQLSGNIYEKMVLQSRLNELNSENSK